MERMSTASNSNERIRGMQIERLTKRKSLAGLGMSRVIALCLTTAVGGSVSPTLLAAPQAGQRTVDQSAQVQTGHEAGVPTPLAAAHRRG